MRHGKAAWPDVPDHERPLAERGRREAGLAGDWIRETFGGVDAVLCSSATRTRETLEATGLDAPATFHDEIYDGWPGALLATITDHAPADAETVLLIGHAPGTPGLAVQLADEDSDPQVVRDVRGGFPTSAIAVLQTDAPWASLGPGGAVLVDYVIAR